MIPRRLCCKTAEGGFPYSSLPCDYAGAMHGLCRGYVVNLPGKGLNTGELGPGEHVPSSGKEGERGGKGERKEREDIEEREERTNMNAGRRRSPRAWLCRQTTNNTHIER